MDEYDKLQHKTRNLEQDYTKYIIRKFKIKQNALQAKCKKISVGYLEQLAEVEAMQSKFILDQIKNLEEERKKFEQEKIIFDSEKNNLLRTQSNSLSNAQEGNRLEEALLEIKNNFTSIKATLDQLPAIKKRQEDTVKYIKELKKTNGVDDTSEFYLKKIKQLEEQIEKMKHKEQELESNDKVVRDLKDNINLLKSSIESKDKTIEILKDQMQKLAKKNESQPKIETTKQGSLDPWALTIPSTSKPVDDTKKAAKSKKKPIDVESIFKEENKSFFNNLSFSNSSPVFDKKFKKGFK